MLISLNIKQCFKHQDSTFDFSKGMTAITGPNFSGKSQILEMIRFALFGAAALRTKVEDYKGAKVSLAFGVNQKTYRVERSTSQAKLWQGEDLLATGTKPVNLKVVDIFGYGLAVFDTANVATQGMIEALGAMPAADRKRLVDSTVGLNVLDDLAKWCSDEAGLKNREVATLRDSVREPVAPEQPAHYRPLAEILAERAGLSALQAEALNLKTSLAAEPPTPVPPECTEPRSLDELEATSRKRSSVASMLDSLKRDLAKLPPPPSMSLEEIDAFEIQWGNVEAQKRAQLFMQTNPSPQYTRVQLARFEAILHDSDAYREWHRLAKQGEHECPACHHRWPIATASMLKLGDWKDKPQPEVPPLQTLQAIRHHEAAIDRYENTATERCHHTLVLAAHPNPIAEPLITTPFLTRMRKAHELTPQRTAITDEIQKLETELQSIPHVVDALAARHLYEQRMNAYLPALQKRQEWEKNRDGWVARLAELEGIDARLDYWIALQVAVQTYDALASAYDRDLKVYQGFQTQIAAKEEEAEQFKRGKEALLEIKTRVKGYLVPSLSKVASMIVSKMTGGAISDIYVNEDFDITVGGKPLNGLSGCGKAATNLALRIGLGQVLTNRVFSVFMADEIDAAMDDDNAEFTAECLRNLTSNIGQIILVSHKSPVADHYIRL